MKMGKSLGNTLEPKDLVQRFGSDAVRYFFLEVEFGNDGDYSEEGFINVVNAHLANTIGNLLNGTLGLLKKNCQSTLAVDSTLAAEGNQLKDTVQKLVKIAIIGITVGGVGLDFSAAQNVVFLELPKFASEILQAEDEDEVPKITVTRKIMHEIDLEVPMPSYETPDVVAAENLVVMSFGLGQQLAPSSCDSLHWFANLALSEEANPEHDDDNGEDIFESLTLQLEEMKPDEYLPQPQEQESQKDENDTGIASLLLTKTRRGQLRKRRQKKDFQKDILPGLVSISRHEVTEDFQAFDCLMRAMGGAWESTLIRRSTGRKGFVGQGRGRRRGKIQPFPSPGSAQALCQRSSQPLIRR